MPLHYHRSPRPYQLPRHNSPNGRILTIICQTGARSGRQANGTANVNGFRNLFSLFAALLPAVCLLGANPTTRLSGRDLQGQPHEIPAAGRPTVVIFVRPGQKQSEIEVSETAQELASSKQLSILGIISGPTDPTLQTDLDAMHWTWPLLTDPSYTLSGAFQVNAWPTTIIFDSQGKIVGRIAGHPPSLKATLAAYVAYATGATTREEMEEQLTRQQIVQDSANEKAYRHLMVVQDFLTSGRTDDAAAQLRQAQDLTPTSDSARLLMARDMLILGETTQADALLATLDSTTQPGELALLRARSAIATGHWQKAKDLLLQAQAATPDPATQAETQYWLGILYTHNNDYQEAAQAFRKAYETARPR